MDKRRFDLKNYIMKSDEELLKEILERETDSAAGRIAFEELYGRYFRKCLLHNYRLLHTRTRSSDQAFRDSEDIAQNKFMKIIKLRNFDFNRDSGQVKNAVRAFLFRIDHNDCINFLKRIWRSTEMDDPDIESMERLLFESGYQGMENPAAQAEISEQIDSLKEALGDLSELQRHTIYLWIQGYSYREMATMLDKSEDKVRGYIWHGLKKVRKQMKI